MIEKLKKYYCFEHDNPINKINEIVDKINEFIEKIDSLDLGAQYLSERIEGLAERAILKPEYEPEDVALNCIAKPGTFEWALIQMKNGKKLKRHDSSHEMYIEDGVFVSNFVGAFNTFNTSIIFKGDWTIQE